MQSKLVTNRQTRRNLFSLAVFLLVSMYAFAQNAVTGIVKDKTGEPLIGVSVVEKEPQMVVLPIWTESFPSMYFKARLWCFLTLVIFPKKLKYAPIPLM